MCNITPQKLSLSQHSQPFFSTISISTTTMTAESNQSMQQQQLHFVLFPFLAQGHMIPMVDIARMLAKNGVIITIFTTPVNAKRSAPILARAIDSGLPIRLVEIQFPSEEVGLPKDCENFDLMPKLSMAREFFTAVSMLHERVEPVFEKLTPKPNCIISDMCHPYTTQIASKLGIPRISFNGFSAFCLLALNNLYTSKVLENITSDTERFIVPGLPDHIELTRRQLPEAAISMNSFGEKVRASELGSYGMIINSFEELEPAYVERYKEAKGDKVWCIGPVSLCNKDDLDKIQRGNKSSIDEIECLKWLNSQEPESVIYACLGSLCNLTNSQLKELGLALEESHKPFIWVLRSGGDQQELEKWLVEDGFEERTKTRGLIIRGWAPQAIILPHTAVGGFLTHCGWNSTLEGITAGKPMITWPLFADQFCNEKLVVKVLKTGVSVGADITIRWGEEEKTGVLVAKEDVKNAIEKVMNGEDEESEEMRRRALKLSEMAKQAVEEGGSSYLNMKLLIEDIKQQAAEQQQVP